MTMTIQKSRAPRKIIFALAAICLVATINLQLMTNPHTSLLHQTPSFLLDIPNYISSICTHKPVVTVGYAISLIKCGDFQSSTAGLIDAALVLRHSVQATSIRNPTSNSRYDYKMYALVHRQAESCSGILQQVGFEVLIVDPPLQQDEIRGEHLRKTIHREWCCGSDEFIKLYAFSKIPEQVVVHVDIDFVFYQPMDELFDAMLLDPDSFEGQAARERIALYQPNQKLPDRIDAFYTLDWPQVIPGRKPGFQAGFMVVRPNETVLQELVEIIKEGNYTEGSSRESGWYSSGHGAYVGAMAMQGLMAYYYEYIRPDTVVELNGCRYNWMGMNVRYTAPPNFYPRKRPELVGKCRNNRDDCEDCMTTDLMLIKNIHYTVCRKPWNCISTSIEDKVNRTKRSDQGVDIKTGSLEQCLKITRIWHELRSDLEDKLQALTNNETLLAGRSGDYKQNVFQGHCTGEGSDNYLQIHATSQMLDNVYRLYE